jgi:hypothetical protein
VEVGRIGTNDRLEILPWTISDFDTNESSAVPITILFTVYNAGTDTHSSLYNLCKSHENCGCLDI